MDKPTMKRYQHNASHGVVWSNPNEDQTMAMAESPVNEVHINMGKVLANKIANVITDDYQSQAIITKLINNLISDQMYVFLEEYDNLVAEDILRSFQNQLTGWQPIEDDAIKFRTKQPDYGHARHAKLNSFANELREKIIILKKSAD